MSSTSFLLAAFLEPQSVDDLMNGSKILLGIRIVITVVGAGVAWLLSGMLWRGLYWIFTQKAMPGLMLVPLKLVSALAVAAAIFFFLPLGFGGYGGLGSGGGQGDGTGKGKGTGPDSGTGTKGTQPTPDGKKNTEESGPEKIDITVLGGEDYKNKATGKYVHGEGKYYKVKLPGKEQPTVMTLKEVEELCNERQNKLTVVLRITGQSAEGAPQDDLIELLEKRKIGRINPPAK